ncbi:hypothetical protein [Rhizohabitans arisaemae]|uniref:hypothetical protein n=1 Tax=Rhizohabitans arisaemae TaxID=2720610 RepID=UPI0024B26D10|nr:hypothetical protein [Rhizohabitans arisaemae]
MVRSNGVPSFPDPDADGAFKLDGNVDAAQLKKAEEACKQYQPKGVPGATPSG